MAEDLSADKVFRHKQFWADIELLAMQSQDLLRTVRENLPDDPIQVRDDAFIESKAEKLSLDPPVFRRLAVTLKFLTIQALQGVDVAERLLQAEERKELAVTDDQLKMLAALASPTDREKRDEKVTEAFSFGNTFADAAFYPLFAPHGDQLLPGGAFVLAYLTPTGERLALTVNISLPELAQLTEKLRSHCSLLRALASHLEEGKK